MSGKGTSSFASRFSTSPASTTPRPSPRASSFPAPPASRSPARSSTRKTSAPWSNPRLDAWFTTGRWAKEFERKLARFVGVRSASLVNSGSSANLVALSALCSPKLGDRQLKPGDEVITVAAGFPTTVNPILQNRLVPVFLDVTLPTYEIDVTHARSRRTARR